jgi:transcriptional regulator with XRE-family HTH domain
VKKAVEDVGVARQTFDRQRLGLLLRAHRERAGLSQREVAEAIGKARSRVVQIEEGVGTPTVADLDRLLDLYGVPATERDDIGQIGARARKRQKRRPAPLAAAIPDSHQRLADIEVAASEISSFEPGVIPSQLQTPDYVRAVFDEANGVFWDLDENALNERVAFRLERQERLWRSAELTCLRYVISEESVRADLGNPGMMAAQLKHLCQLVDSESRLKVRVLPTGAPGNPARGSGLVLFDFGDRAPAVGVGPVLLSPSPRYTAPQDVAILRRTFDRVWNIALNESDSRNMVLLTAEKYERQSRHRLVHGESQFGG